MSSTRATGGALRARPWHSLLDRLSELLQRLRGRAPEPVVHDHARLRQLIDGLGPSIFVGLLTPAGVLIEANRSGLAAAGLKREDVLGKPFDETPWWTHSAHVQQQLREAMARGARGECSRYDVQLRAADAEIIDVDFSLQVVRDEEGKVAFLVPSASVITERKRAEAALDAERARLIAAQSVAKIGSWELDLGTHGVIWSAESYRIFGVPKDGSPLTQQGIVDLIHPDDRAAAAEQFGRLTSLPGPQALQHRLLMPDGSIKFVDERWETFTDAQGQPWRVIGTSQDVTARKESEDAAQRGQALLRMAAEEYQLLFEANPHPMWVFDVQTLAFLAVNEAAVRLYGYSNEEFLGMTIKDIRPPEEVPALLAHLTEMPDTPGLVATQVKHRRKDGSLMEVEGASNPIEFQGRRARLVMAHDATDKKLLQEQLLQAQKMDAIGRLAGGVAHDFNNVLGVILGYAEILLRGADAGQRGKLEQILKATERAAGLTRQLLAFSRKQVVEPRVLDLNALLGDLEPMLERLIGEHIDITIIPGADLGQVKADPGQLEQVVINLCVNARDAMPEGGVLRLETENADVSPGRAGRNEAIGPGRYVVLTVRDAGVGIEQALLSKVFEPFFTTKEQGKGIGLGLAMVYGTVKQAGGYVWVDSEVGRGTTFKVYLPRTDEHVAPEPPAPPLPDDGSETILLTEDEHALRALAREILEEHGYRVLEAASPAEAIAIALQHREGIDLLLTDVVMPGMDGRFLAQSVRAVRPGLKVLYMSGYTDDILANSGVLESGTLLLQKPFSTAALLGRVRSALGERVAAG